MDRVVVRVGYRMVEDHAGEELLYRIERKVDA